MQMVSLKGLLTETQMELIGDNRVLYNYQIDKRIMEETKECTCRKMSDAEKEKYCKA